MATVNGTSGDDDLTDTSDADVVNGLAGNDILTSTGTGGNITAEVYDQMNGGDGLDTLVVKHNRNDVAVVNIGYFHAMNPFTEGWDGRMWGGDGYIDYRSIERFVIFAGDRNDQIETFDGNDIVYAEDGNNVVRTGAGNDLIYSGYGKVDLAGGAGDDTYFLADAGGADFPTVGGVDELFNEGFDIIYAINSYTLGTNSYIERLALFFADDTRDLTLTGNARFQQMSGNAGNNIIDGGGGAGDVMYGLGGNDTFIVTSGTVIVELAGEGFDTVVASVYQLNAGASVEVITAANPAGTGQAILVGNELSQTLFGNQSGNQLNGNGGGDLMIGYGGNDLYTVNHPNDIIVEAVSGGTDQVFVTRDYDLNAGAEIEKIQTILTSSTAPISITGNEFAQQIDGNAGNNSLNGNGGGDTMFGFGGNDVYTISNLADSIIETSGLAGSATTGGLDTVYTPFSFTLGAGDSIEFFSTILHSATTAIDLTGNEFGQVISGNAGSNRLNGAAGNDTMSGFGGSDTFVFNSALGASNIDTLTDFEVGVDHIELAQARFAALAPGALSASAFATGTQAGDADDRIIYNSATGALLYDADGTGAGGAVQFAILQPGLALSHMDFIVA